MDRGGTSERGARTFRRAGAGLTTLIASTLITLAGLLLARRAASITAVLIRTVLIRTPLIWATLIGATLLRRRSAATPIAIAARSVG